MNAKAYRMIRPVRFGKYTLLQRIGYGGMAEIFLAKKYSAYGFEKELVIKRILDPDNGDQEFIERLTEEVKFTMNLAHNNIVEIFDFGAVDGTYFIAMEYVYGKDLHELLARCVKRKIVLPMKLILFILMELLKGLHYAHTATDIYGRALGLVHRDISPTNVFLSYTGEVKIGDFGIAKSSLTQRPPTEVGLIKGKIGYMSPEQVNGDAVDCRSDIFSVGIMLFEMIKMARMFPGKGDWEIMRRVYYWDVDSELSQLGDLDIKIEHILRSSLTQSPEDRYPNAMAMYNDLLEATFCKHLRVSNVDLASFLNYIFQAEIDSDRAYRETLLKREPVI